MGGGDDDQPIYHSAPGRNAEDVKPEGSERRGCYRRTLMLDFPVEVHFQVSCCRKQKWKKTASRPI